MAQGLSPVPEWQSCYFHDQLRLFLVVYVDDFKMSGPTENMAQGWELLRKASDNTPGIEMDDPKPVGRYLGCEHVVSKRKSPITGKIVNSIEYDMSDFFKQAVSDYKKLLHSDFLRKVSTPFIPDPIDDLQVSLQLYAAAAKLLVNADGLSDVDTGSVSDMYADALAELKTFF